MGSVILQQPAHRTAGASLHHREHSLQIAFKVPIMGLGSRTDAGLSTLLLTTPHQSPGEVRRTGEG